MATRRTTENVPLNVCEEGAIDRVTFSTPSVRNMPNGMKKTVAEVLVDGRPASFLLPMMKAMYAIRAYQPKTGTGAAASGGSDESKTASDPSISVQAVTEDRRAEIENLSYDFDALQGQFETFIAFMDAFRTKYADWVSANAQALLKRRNVSPASVIENTFFILPKDETDVTKPKHFRAKLKMRQVYGADRQPTGVKRFAPTFFNKYVSTRSLEMIKEESIPTIESLSEFVGRDDVVTLVIRPIFYILPAGTYGISFEVLKCLIEAELPRVSNRFAVNPFESQGWTMTTAPTASRGGRGRGRAAAGAAAGDAGQEDGAAAHDSETEVVEGNPDELEYVEEEEEA